MILDIDNNPPDPMDISEIFNDVVCLKCRKKFNGVADIIFTRVGAYQWLIWWHKKCDDKKTQSDNR